MPSVFDSQSYSTNLRFNSGARPPTTRQVADNRDTLIRMRCILKNQLNQAQLPNMPAGFPFHYSASGHGSHHLSEGPYEFRQEIRSSTYGDYTQTAIFSFMDPTTSLRTRGCDKYIWCISLPTFEPNQHPDSRVVMAEVQVDVSVMHSQYGLQYLRKDPRIICKALATSLEHGLKITIAIADYKLANALTSPGMKCLPSAGDIIYIGTNTDCQQQILNILDGRGYWAKFSACP